MTFFTILKDVQSALRLRPVACVAGLTAITAGSIYLYRRLSAQWERNGDEDGTQDHQESADPETVVNNIFEEGDEAEAGPLILIQYSPLFCGPLVAIQRNFSAEMETTSQNMLLRWTCDYQFGLEGIRVTTHYANVVRGLERQVWWSCSTQRSTWNQEGTLQSCTLLQEVAGFKRTAGEIRHFMSYAHHQTSVFTDFDNNKVTDVSVKFQGVYVGPSGLLSTSEWTDGHTSLVPTESHPSPSDQGSEEDMPATEVPRMHEYFRTRGVRDFPVKLAGIRQAFEVLLMDSVWEIFLSLTGKMILRKMVVANKKDQTEFQQAYDQLVDFLKGPSSHRGMQEDIATAGIGQSSFVDLFFEFVLLGLIVDGIDYPSYRPGGFLGHLHVLLMSLTAHEGWESAAVEVLGFVQGRLLSWMEDIFAQDLPLYELPGELAAVVVESFEWHVQELLSILTDM